MEEEEEMKEKKKEKETSSQISQVPTNQIHASQKVENMCKLPTHVLLWEEPFFDICPHHSKDQSAYNDKCRSDFFTFGHSKHCDSHVGFEGFNSRDKAAHIFLCHAVITELDGDRNRTSARSLRNHSQIP